jgi:hypothetical protein
MKIRRATQTTREHILMFGIIVSDLGCGSRSALFEGMKGELSGPGIGGSNSPIGTGGAGTGGSAAPSGSGGWSGERCIASLDLNSGPGEWLDEVRLSPVSGDGFSVTLPSIVTTTRGVSLAYLLSPPLLDDEDPHSPGLMFSHSGTPVGTLDPRFSFELVDDTATSGGSLATDGDSFFVSYLSADGLKLATKADGTWTSELVVTLNARANFDWSPGCAIDESGVLHIVYEDSGSLRHATKAQSTWTLRSVLSPDSWSPVRGLELDVDQDGVLHAVWLVTSADENILKYASYRNEWTVEEVTTPVQADDVAFRVTSDGQAHVVILDRSLVPVPLHYGRRESDGWSFEAIDVGSELRGFGYVSLDLGPDGSSHVLKGARSVTAYATSRTGTWETELINLSAEDGASLAVDASGAVHAVSRYFNYPLNTAPHYATNRALVLDGVDQNCDGVDGIDSDRDGLSSRWTGGDDGDE